MKWTFQQVEGPPSLRKTLELDGWSAPFGRPRQDPVIKELIKSRVQVTHYPGSSRQSRHAFGTNWEPTELKGRWMTKELVKLGKTAKDVADEWTAFLQDERTIRISWGVITSYIGFLEELELSRESEHEIAWRMKLIIDEREDTRYKVSTSNRYRPIEDDIAELQLWQKAGIQLAEPTLPNLSPDFLESVDNLVRDLNQPAAELAKLAGAFSDFEKGTFAALQTLRGALSGLRTALTTFRETLLDADINAAMLVRTAESDIAWARWQCETDAQTISLLFGLSQLDVKLELQAEKFIQAIEGDTWESLSTRATGGPDKAAKIRELNGIRFGEQPVVGESYYVL